MTDEPISATPPIAISTEVTVPLERITNSLIGALEGGSTYWLREIEYVEGSATGTDYERPHYADEHFWNDGGRAKLTYDNPEQSEEDDGDQVSKEVGMAEFKVGLATMAAKCPRHFGDLVAENDDTITHDVFIQCVLFGDVVYG